MYFHEMEAKSDRTRLRTFSKRPFQEEITTDDVGTQTVAQNNGIASDKGSMSTKKVMNVFSYQSAPLNLKYDSQMRSCSGSQSSESKLYENTKSEQNAGCQSVGLRIDFQRWEYFWRHVLCLIISSHFDKWTNQIFPKLVSC